MTKAIGEEVPPEGQPKQNPGQQQENNNYLRTSIKPQQSGMSAENMTGNAAVLGGAIASAAVIPFVGWIVVLAILYSFKDKFKDDPKANKEFENEAKSNGLKDDELQKLKDKAAQLKERELKKTTTHQDDIIKDLGDYIMKNPNALAEITDILEEKDKAEDKAEELKKFIKEKVYKGKATDEQKEDINSLLTDPNIKKQLVEVIKNIQQNQENVEEFSKTDVKSNVEKILKYLNSPKPVLNQYEINTNPTGHVAEQFKKDLKNFLIKEKLCPKLLQEINESLNTEKNDPNTLTGIGIAIEVINELINPPTRIQQL